MLLTRRRRIRVSGFFFLKSLWPDDQQAINTLQEIFGYLITSDTKQQKIFSLVGPMRSGKGTIARILTALLGQDSVCRSNPWETLLNNSELPL